MKTGLIAHIKEIFSLLILALLYGFWQTRYDPSASDIERDKTGKAKQQPILLVHGYLHNSSGWIYLRHLLRKAGYQNIFTVNLGAFPNKTIEQYAEILGKRIHEVTTITGRNDLTLVAHSMGGVISAYYTMKLAKLNDVEVSKVITIGSPLRGTKVNIIGFGPCARQLSYESPFTTSLSEEIKRATNRKYYHIACRHDFIIIPFTSALNGCEAPKENSYLAYGIGHATIFFSKEIGMQILRFLQCLPNHHTKGDYLACKNARPYQG